MNQIRFRLDRGAVLPTRATDGSAGYDLCIKDEVALKDVTPSFAMGHTGVHVEIPSGYVGIVAIRSSVGAKLGVTLSNGVGIIDSDYRGEIGIPMVNLSGQARTFPAGERVAQIIVVKCITPEPIAVAKLSETDRGDGGFGSTN